MLGRAARRRRLRHGLRGGLRLAAHLCVSDACLTLSGAVAVMGALARRKKGFPRDARRIVDPRLFRLGIATGGLCLLDDRAAGFVQPCIDLLQLVLALNLNAEMIEPRLLAAR